MAGQAGRWRAVRLAQRCAWGGPAQLYLARCALGGGGAMRPLLQRETRAEGGSWRRRRTRGRAAGVREGGASSVPLLFRGA